MEKYLPQKSQVILKCDMSAWQKVYYHQVTDVGRVGLATGMYFITELVFLFILCRSVYIRELGFILYVALLVISMHFAVYNFLSWINFRV